MIMARNEDGTYSQVGFVKDNVGIDTEYIYDKDGDIVFEKGFTRETSGTVPLTINGIGKDLKDWSITGNTVQDGTPTPENPVEVLGCGDYDSDTGMYKIPVVTSADGTEPITTPIYLDAPLYKIEGYADRLSKTEEVRVVKELVLTGTDADGGWEASTTRKGSFYLNIGPNAVVGCAICDRATNVNNIVNYHYGNVFTEQSFAFSTVFINLWLFDTAITLADFKSYLAAQYAAGTPVKVYYVMQTPKTKTVEPVEIPTINGTTIIDVDTAVKPTEMYTKYKSSK